MGAPHVVVGHNDSDRRVTGRTGRLTGSLLLLEKSKRSSRVPGPLPTFGVDRMTVSWLGAGRSFRFLGALMNDRSANNDVLLGILAVEMKFISRDQLVRGAKVWNENPNSSLAETLESLKLLSSSDRQSLEKAVVDRIRQSDDTDESVCPTLDHTPSDMVQDEEASGSNSPTLDHTPSAEDLTNLTNESYSLWAANSEAIIGDPDAEDAIYHPATDPQSIRFKKIRFHEKGGLGEIHVAMDREVPREVALKEIKPRYANVQASRERFAQEARITGALEHPGVVPVYGLGHYPDGQLYYVMRFIEGETLSKAVSRYHKSGEEQCDPGQRRLEFRRLLNHFIDVCQVIDYAHNRDIIHRDIKPDNVMLGCYGETLVVDWGLAKKMDEEELESESKDEHPSPVKIRSASTTLPGSVVGTPAYMSPEQALGSVDQVGPASDVYSLGATLYRVLTGKFPFQGDTALEQVAAGNFKHPCEVAPDVPRALEAICVKAMSPEPEDRYESAGELAADMECWLADEPVSVYREPFLQRIFRFVRHHKVTVSASAALLMTALIAVVVWLQVEASRDSQSLSDVQKNLGAGEEALAANDLPKALMFFTQAEAVAKKRTSLKKVFNDAAMQRQHVEQTISTRADFDAMLGQIDKNMDEVRFRTVFGDMVAGRNLIRSIYDAYQQGGWAQRLESEDLDHEAVNQLREHMAEAIVLLARAEVDSAPKDKQAASLRDAIAMLADAEQLRRGRRAIYRLRSDYYQMLGEADQAESDRQRLLQTAPATAFDFFLEGTDARTKGDIFKAISEYENALAENPDHVWSHMMLAVCWLQLQQPVRAIAAYDQVTRLRPQFAWAFAGKALALARLGDWEAAHAALNRAESIAPNLSAVANNRGVVYLTRATTAGEGASVRQKMKWLSLASEQFRRSHEQEPTDPGPLSNLGATYAERAAIFRELGKKESAQKELDQAIDNFSQALGQYPDYLEALLGRGETRMRFEELDAALQDLLTAQRVAPRDPRVEYRLGGVYERLAERAASGNNIASAREYLQQAERSYGRTLRVWPQDPRAFLGRGRVRHRLWQLAQSHGGTKNDPSLVKQAIADFDVAEAWGAGKLGRDALAGLYSQRADLKAGSGREDEAIVDYQLATQQGGAGASIHLRLGWARLLDTLSAEKQFDQALQGSDQLNVRQQAEAYNGRGYAEALLGKDTKACADADAAVKLAGGRWQVLYNAATVYAVATGIAEYELQDSKLADARAKRTLDLLRKAIGLGLDKDIIRQDRAFVSLKHRPEFQAMVE